MSSECFYSAFLILRRIVQHWIVNVIRANNALVKNGGILDGSLMSYGRISDPLDVASAGALYSLEIAIADMIMVCQSPAMRQSPLDRSWKGLSSLDCVGA